MVEPDRGVEVAGRDVRSSALLPVAPRRPAVADGLLDGLQHDVFKRLHVGLVVEVRVDSRVRAWVHTVGFGHLGVPEVVFVDAFCVMDIQREAQLLIGNVVEEVLREAVQVPVESPPRPVLPRGCLIRAMPVHIRDPDVDGESSGGVPVLDEMPRIAEADVEPPRIHDSERVLGKEGVRSADLVEVVDGARVPVAMPEEVPIKLAV